MPLEAGPLGYQGPAPPLTGLEPSILIGDAPVGFASVEENVPEAPVFASFASFCQSNRGSPPLQNQGLSSSPKVENVPPSQFHKKKTLRVQFEEPPTQYSSPGA